MKTLCGALGDLPIPGGARFAPAYSSALRRCARCAVLPRAMPLPALPALPALAPEPWRSDFEKDFAALATSNPGITILEPLGKDWGLRMVQHYVPLFALAMTTSSVMRHHVLDAWWKLGGGDKANPDCKRTPFCMPLPSPWSAGGLQSKKFPGMEVVVFIVTLLLVFSPMTAALTLLLYWLLLMA
jgi:hypothetical protein